MNIWLGSDLHTEFPGNADLQVSATDADIAILAGDIGVGGSGIEWAARTFDIPTIYIGGNHEHYDKDLEKNTEEMRELAKSHGIYFLENDTVEIGGLTFAGCTLWTDYAALDDAEEGMATAALVMADHRLIRYGERGFEPRDALAIHMASVEWLEELSEIDVVVTHHCPSLTGIGDRHPLNEYTPAFASRLDGLIERLRPVAWVFGHTHDSVNRVHPCGTQLISNQRGYPMESVHETGWDPGCTIVVK